MKYLTLFLLLATPAAAQELRYDYSATLQCLEDKEDIVAKYPCIGAAATACMEATEGGWSTAGQNACLDRELADWDARLNDTYRHLKAQLEALDAEIGAGQDGVPSQAAALRDMQRAWIGFRDAACAFEASQWTGGTGAGPAALWCHLYETAEQALRLESTLVVQ